MYNVSAGINVEYHSGKNWRLFGSFGMIDNKLSLWGNAVAKQELTGAYM